MPAPWTLDYLLAEITNLARNTLDFREPHALAAVERDPEGARKKLLPFLESGERAVEYRAGTLLLHLKAPEGMTWLFRYLATEPRAGLVEIAHAERRAIPLDKLEAAVLPLLSTDDADVAIHALARYATPGATAAMLRCIRHENPRVRESALRHLVFPNVRDLSTEQRLARAQRIRNGELVDPPLAIGHEVVDAIVELLEPEDFSFALRALQQVINRGTPGHAQRAAEELAARVAKAIASKKKPSSPIVEAVVRDALGVVHDALGDPARPLLEKAAQSTVPAIRREATERLARAGGDSGKRQVLASLADPALSEGAATAILAAPGDYRDEATPRALLAAIRVEIPRSRRRHAIAEKLRTSGATANRMKLIAELVSLQGGSLRALADALLAIDIANARLLVKLDAALPPSTRMRLRWIEKSLTLAVAATRLRGVGLPINAAPGGAGVEDPAAAVTDLLASTGRYVHLDTEAPRVPPDYEALLEDFMTASAGAFEPREIEQSMDLVPDDVDRVVRFRHRGERYELTAKNRGDWYDVDAALGAIHKALEDAMVRERFVELLPDAQCRRFVFVDEAAFRKAAASIHLALPAPARKPAKRKKRATGSTKKKPRRRR